MMMSVLAVACAEGIAVTSDNNSVRIAEMAAATRGADARGSAIDEEGNTIGTPCVPWKAEAGSWSWPTSMGQDQEKLAFTEEYG